MLPVTHEEWRNFLDTNGLVNVPVPDWVAYRGYSGPPVRHADGTVRRAWDRMHRRQVRRERETSLWVDLGGES